MDQHTRFSYLSNRLEEMAQTSLRICAVSSETSLLACKKYVDRGRLRPKKRPPSSLDALAWELKDGLYVYAISAKISYLGPDMFSTRD